MAFSEKFEDALLLVAEKVDGNQYLTAIKNAFTAYMPFIIVGSFATLFNTLICSTSIGLAALIPAAASLKPAFTAINFATMSFMTIPIVFLIAMNLAKNDNLPPQLAGVAAACAYITVIPQTVAVLVDGVANSAAGLASTTLGAQGLFIGMIIAVIAEKIFARLMKFEAIKIKMPPSVPAAISQSFNTLIPILITLTITAVGGILFYLATGSYLNEWVYSVIQSPLEVIFQSPVFWFLGIHGGLIISPIRNPLMSAAIAANTAAVAAGSVANQPVTMGFWTFFIVAGGAGMILSLIIAIFLFSKREDHRMIAKLGAIPALCGISEPVVFGLPLVLNPTFAIPFIFNSGIATATALLATNIGLMPCNTVDAPFGLPIMIGAFIGHGWQGVVVQLIIIAVTTLVWIPFVLMSNKQAQKEAGN